MEFKVERSLAETLGSLTDAQRARLERALERSFAQLVGSLHKQPKPSVDTWMRRPKPSFCYSPGS